MPKNRTIEHIPAQASGPDLALMALGDHLRSRLGWVDNVYSLARVIRGRRNDSSVVGPGESRVRRLVTYAGQNEYIDLLPSGELGNYIALHLKSVDSEGGLGKNIGLLRRDTLRIWIVAFFDFKRLGMGSADALTEGTVAEKIKTALSTLSSQGIACEANGLEVDPEDVFYPADLSLTDPVLLRRPYGCLSLAVSMTVDGTFYSGCQSLN